jgi:VCBS repeat-containing protein
MAYEQESPLYNGKSNNTVSSADGLTSGVKMVAALDSASDVDFFRINTSGPSLITLDFLSPLLTTSSHWQVRLLDANGDYLRMLASSVQGTPLVNGASESGTSLKVDGLSSVPAAGSQFTLVTTGADTTVYKVVSATALVGGGSTLTLDKALPSGLSDNTALAFDPAQLVTGVSSSVTASVPAAGTYSIQVLADGAVWNSADYALTATVTPTLEKEGTGGNNTKEDAAFASNRLLANTSMTGALSGASDVDYWVFTTAKPSDFSVSFGSSSSASNPEWKIDITQWSGAPLSDGSLSAGSSSSLSVPATSFATAQTFVVAVSPFSSTAFNTGNYTLKVAGSGLDLNDAPVLSVGTVSIRVPEPGVVVDTLVVRNVSAGSSSGVRLDSLFSATDPDAASSGQFVSYYRFSLTKDEGLSSDAAVRLVSGGVTKTYGFDLAAGMLPPGSVILTDTEMATAVFLPGATAAGSTLKLALQAYDSTSTLSALGGADGSGASAILQQTLKIVSGNVGVSLDSSATQTTLSESLNGEGSSKPHSSSFAVALNQAPTHDVKFYLTDANDQLDLSVGVLTFTSANYATAQSVSITATADSKNEGVSQSAPLRFQVVSQDSSYDGFLVSPLTFSVADNAAPVLSTPTAIGYADTQAQDSFSAPAAGSVSGTLSASDANVDTLSYGILGGTDALTTVSKTSSLGTLTVTKATGAYVFSPDTDGLDAASGITSIDFTVTASDGTASSSKALTVSVTGVNDTPILEFVDPSAPLLERGGAGNSVAGISDAQVTLSLFDAESSVSLDAAGLLTLGWATTNEGVTYTRAGNFGSVTINSSTLQLAYVLNDNDPRTQGLEDSEVDTDIFWVQVRDAQGLISKTSFIFGVTGANDWPVLTAISDRLIAPDQAISFDLENELSDADSNLTVSATLADGTPLPSWLGFNSTSWTFSGTPAASDLAALSILVVASDGAGGTVYDNFDITVAAASQNAILLADSKAGNEDGGVIIGNVLTNDTAPIGENNSLSLSTYAVNGYKDVLNAGQTFRITGKGDVQMNSNGSYTFTPLPDTYGKLPVITYDTNDGSSTLTLTVSPVDDASVLTADSKTVAEGSTVTGNVLLNDSDIDNTLAVASFRVAGNQTTFNAGQVATLANQGTLLVQADGSYVFTPLTDFNGAVSQVTYTLNTGSSSTLGLNLTAVNDAPTGAVLIDGTVKQGQVLTASNTLADADGLGTVSYAWKADGQAISNAANATFKLGLAQVGKLITVEARYTDLGGTPESKLSGETVAVASDPNAPAGVNVEVQAFAWKSHVFLNGVGVGLNAATSVDTAGQGKVVFSDVVDPASLTASLSATDTYSEGAVNLQDAIAILKLVVGLPVNGTNQALSPYQMFAADYNGNGVVELSDAIDVLKYVVGLPGTQPSWKFLNETTAVGSLTALPTQPGTLPAVELPVDNGDASLRVGLVGFLRGDVDGSYAGAANAEALSSDYFLTLATEHQLNTSQFGVY